MHDSTPNDRRTREALDELADMLLTGPVELPSPFVDKSRPRHADGKPAPGETSGPLRIEPERPVAPVDPTLDAVIVGHLPGFAGPWVAQLADHAAAADTTPGGLALLRLTGSAIELELFDDGPALDAFERDAGPVTDLPTALALLAERVSDYAIVIDNPNTERGRSRLANVHRWTVICSANDAAVVAAYRQLKALIVDAGVPVPPQGVRLTLMGCNEAEAAAAAERLAKAASTHLRLTIAYAGFRQKMQPIRRAHLGRFDLGAGVDPWLVVHGFFQPPDTPAPTAPRRPDADTDDPTSDLLTADELAALAAIHEDEALPTDHDADLVSSVDPIEAEAAIEPADDDAANTPEHAIDDELEQRLIRSMQENETDDDASPLPPGEGKGEGELEPSLATEPPAPVIAPADTLAAYLAGSRTLEARCPHQPGVELAVESDGRFALMLNATGADTGAAIRSLLSARQWTIAHRALLALTDRDVDIDPAADPICHLFTDQPRVALELAYAGLTDTSPIHLHLLKPVDIDGRTTMVHEPLS